MSRILLADDSPHAQRMGERILREEGFEVVSVTDGDAAMLRLLEADPDVVLADVFLPKRSGIDLCRHLKGARDFRHTRVVLTAGLLEPFDENEGRLAGCDAILKKPFEATAVMETIRPLMEAARFARGLFGETAETRRAMAGSVTAAVALRTAEFGEVDPERVRAAITIALDRALPAMVEEVTERVLIALGH
jgi:CheY-like chemotaxis protein